MFSNLKRHNLHSFLGLDAPLRLSPTGSSGTHPLGEGTESSKANTPREKAVEELAIAVHEMYALWVSPPSKIPGGCSCSYESYEN